MKLIYAPGACSIGIHVLLEEIGKPYEAEAASLQVPAAERPLTKVNAKSKVPTLIRDENSVLTEFPAIAYYLAKKNPEAGLFSDDLDAQVTALEMMDYCVATLHMQGFTRIFRPGNFTPTEADQDKVKARGRDIVESGFKIVDEKLGHKEYVAGAFSIADAALFYVEFWAAGRMKIDLPPNCAAHFARMNERPSVRSVMKKEGLA